MKFRGRSRQWSKVRVRVPKPNPNPNSKVVSDQALAVAEADRLVREEAEKEAGLALILIMAD